MSLEPDRDEDRGMEQTTFSFERPDEHPPGEDEVVPRKGLGAGEGYRTLVFSLGICRSAIELHPRGAAIVSFAF